MTTTTATPHCPTCNAALASDQRYCLNCGHRLTPPRVDFEHSLGLGPAPAAPVQTKTSRWERSGPLPTLMALGAVLLALGVGIVIGRGNGSAMQAKPQVVTVAGGAAPTSGTAASTAQPVGAVSDDWPSGTSGYTIELGTIAKAGATAATVATAKSNASGKGASAVGALDGDAHGGTPTGTYVIYSGDYSSKKQAMTAAAKLKKSFPGALVLHVTPSGSGSGGGGNGSSGGSKSGGGGGTNAGTSAASSLKNKSGNAYVKASAKLPSTVGTGSGPPPKKDNKKAGGGTAATCIGC